MLPDDDDDDDDDFRRMTARSGFARQSSVSDARSPHPSHATQSPHRHRLDDGGPLSGGSRQLGWKMRLHSPQWARPWISAASLTEREGPRKGPPSTPPPPPLLEWLPPWLLLLLLLVLLLLLLLLLLPLLAPFPGAASALLQKEDEEEEEEEASIAACAASASGGCIDRSKFGRRSSQ